MMAVSAKLQWVMQQAIDGRDMKCHIGPGANEAKENVKFTIRNVPTTSRLCFVKSVIQMMLDNIDEYHFVTHSHDHSSGATVVTFNLWSNRNRIDDSLGNVTFDPYGDVNSPGGDDDSDGDNDDDDALGRKLRGAFLDEEVSGGLFGQGCAGSASPGDSDGVSFDSGDKDHDGDGIEVQGSVFSDKQVINTGGLNGQGPLARWFDLDDDVDGHLSGSCLKQENLETDAAREVEFYIGSSACSLDGQEYLETSECACQTTVAWCPNVCVQAVSHPTQLLDVVVMHALDRLNTEVNDQFDRLSHVQDIESSSINVREALPQASESDDDFAGAFGEEYGFSSCERFEMQLADSNSKMSNLFDKLLENDYVVVAAPSNDGSAPSYIFDFSASPACVADVDAMQHMNEKLGQCVKIEELEHLLQHGFSLPNASFELNPSEQKLVNNAITAACNLEGDNKIRTRCLLALRSFLGARTETLPNFLVESLGIKRHIPSGWPGFCKHVHKISKNKHGSVFDVLLDRV